MRNTALLALALLLFGCAQDEPSPFQEQVDVCEQAARHREACVGEYVTPPICDEAAAAAAQDLLVSDCEQLSAMQALGKADGALCDWFGAGCTPDEDLFQGAACKRDADCTAGFCAEGHCFGGVDSDEFVDIMDRWTNSIELSGSATHLLVANDETRALRRSMVESATQSVHFSAFLIEEDETGEEMIEMFTAAAKRGVEVRVLIDATTQYSFASYDVLERLAAGGVQVIPFNAALEWAGLRFSANLTVNDRLHEKLLIVDGREAVMGGRNVALDYFDPTKWRDTDVYVSGPGVAGIQSMYLGIWDKDAAWELEAGCPNADKYGLFCPDGRKLIDESAYYPAMSEEGPAKTRAIYSDPSSQPTPLGYLTTLALVRSAQKSITLANSYFVPPRRLRKHLKAAAARGVKVTVLTNSLQSTDAWWMYYASINYYEELIRAGIEIHQYNGTETMHSKTMLIDDTLAVVGSYNLDPRSAVDNSESMLLIRDGKAVEELRQAFVVDLANSKIASYDLPLTDKLKAKSFRLVEPLL